MQGTSIKIRPMMIACTEYRICSTKLLQEIDMEYGYGYG